MYIINSSAYQRLELNRLAIQLWVLDLRNTRNTLRQALNSLRLGTAYSSHRLFCISYKSFSIQFHLLIYFLICRLVNNTSFVSTLSFAKSLKIQGQLVIKLSEIEDNIWFKACYKYLLLIETTLEVIRKKIRINEKNDLAEPNRRAFEANFLNVSWFFRIIDT